MTGVVDDVNLIAHFLALRDVQALEDFSHVDLALLAGNSVLHSAEIMADVLTRELAPQVLISGGIGHSTGYLREQVERDRRFCKLNTEGRAEATILADVLATLGVPASKILLETASTNCGANAVESKATIDALGLTPRRVLLIQDPTMQRRSDASFRRAWRGIFAPHFVNFAPFIPRVESRSGQLAISNPVPGAWSTDRFLSLLLGEIPRLCDTELGYGPMGRDFIEHVDVPQEVQAAHTRLANAFPEFHR